MTSIDAAVLDELRPQHADGRLLAPAGPAPAQASKRWGGGGAVMKMSLDAYVTFLDEALRGHEAVRQALPLAGDGAGLGGQSSVGGKAAPAPAPVATAGGGALPSLAEGALTELLRFQVVLQAQQTSPRKVNIYILVPCIRTPVFVYPLGLPSLFLYFVCFRLSGGCRRSAWVLL